MDSKDDPIKALLDKTGLSCDDLLQKLLAYKSQAPPSENVPRNTAAKSSGENVISSTQTSEPSSSEGHEGYSQKEDEPQDEQLSDKNKNKSETIITTISSEACIVEKNNDVLSSNSKISDHNDSLISQEKSDQGETRNVQISNTVEGDKEDARKENSPSTLNSIKNISLKVTKDSTKDLLEIVSDSADEDPCKEKLQSSVSSELDTFNIKDRESQLKCDSEELLQNTESCRKEIDLVDEISRTIEELSNNARENNSNSLEKVNERKETENYIFISFESDLDNAEKNATLKISESILKEKITNNEESVNELPMADSEKRDGFNQSKIKNVTSQASIENTSDPCASEHMLSGDEIDTPCDKDEVDSESHTSKINKKNVELINPEKISTRSDVNKVIGNIGETREKLDTLECLSEVDHDEQLGKAIENIGESRETQDIFKCLSEVEQAQSNEELSDPNTIPFESADSLSKINPEKCAIDGQESSCNINVMNISTETRSDGEFTKSAVIHHKRKSISDELVRRLAQRVSCDTFEENNIIVRNEETENISSENVESERENDIEVCQVDDLEAVCRPQKPLLKLRSDLFENENKKGFSFSDDDSDSKSDDISSTEMKEFLKSIEVTEDINNQLSDDNSDNSRSICENNSENSTVSPNLIIPKNSSKPPGSVNRYDVNTNLRKVKIGFIKKKILTKAIRNINNVDHRKFLKPVKDSGETIETDNLLQISRNNPVTEGDNSEAQEEVRKNLKLQLSSLRNRKNKDGLVVLKVRSKVPSIEDLKFNYRKQLLDKKITKNMRSDIPITSPTKISKKNAFSQKETEPFSRLAKSVVSPVINSEQILPDIVKASTRSMKTSIIDELSKDTSEKENSDFITLTEDANFSITNVEGSVGSPDVHDGDEIEDDKEVEVHRRPDPIKLTKTNDITKIKGWKNKKFNVFSNNECNDSEESKNGSSNGDNTCPEVITSRVSSCDQSKDDILPSEENSNEELSPFVSNTLEEFLTENSTLNISYKIPKLGAEESFNEDKYKSVIVPKIDFSQTVNTGKKEKPRGIKAKTLAEKRRMLQGELIRKDDEKKDVPEKKKSITKSSYVNFNGTKIYVSSFSSNQCLEIIEHKVSRPHTSANSNPGAIKDVIPKKLSLLEQWHHVEYHPGPLSKKSFLQKSDGKWQTKVQKLPTICLEIIPRVGNAIRPELRHLLPKFGPVIKEDRLEFALSAVKTKGEKKERKIGFRFTVPYANNQKFILVREKTRKIFNNTVICDSNESNNKRNSVSSVINDLITYVENKEEQDSIIKDAEPYVEDEEENEIKECEPAEDKSTNKKSKRRALDMECIRLSCKVVSFSVDDAEKDILNCKKSYCALGCICRSLACPPILPLHCSRVECMFECKCSRKSEITVTDGKSSLSSDTMTRIEDQAKRFLAKEEKEFTQTIIHADDKTILIPSSDRSKSKRVKRMPKRFSDYFDEEKIKHYETNYDNYNCYVQLDKLNNLESVVPLCLDHNRYGCSCLIVIKKKRKNSLTEEDIIEEHNPYQKRFKRKKYNMMDNDNDTVSGTFNEQMDISEIENLVNNNSNKKKEIKKEGCARTLGVVPEFIARNKIPQYQEKLKSKTKNTEFLPSYIPEELMSEILERESNSIDVLTPLQIKAADRLKFYLYRDKNKHKRKQVLKPRDDRETERITYKSVFDGEIVISTNENKDFVKKLGMKSVAPFMRLLPWNDLLKNYYERKVNIWCCKEKAEKLLINTRFKEPPKDYIHIERAQKKTGIMTWILTRRLPKQTPPELVHLILSPNKDHFEISGICLKNISSRPCFKARAHDQNKSKSMEEVGKVINPIPREDDNIESKETDPNFLEHKNHNNELSVLCMTQHAFPPSHFYLSRESEGMSTENYPLALELPSFKSKDHRWRMLYMNSNFSFLSFVNNKYSIKYTDLMHIVKKASFSNKSICLQSMQLSSGYLLKDYGIYAVPRYRDRLFIGPYKDDESHGLETLRYLRQSLVSTSYFEYVQGGVNPNNKMAVWIVNKTSRLKLDPNNPTNLNNPLPVSNKTPENEDGEADNDGYAKITPILMNSSKRSTMGAPNPPPSRNRNNSSTNQGAIPNMNFFNEQLDSCGNFITSMDLDERASIQCPQFTIVNGKKMQPQDYNRYIMTNIPHFGYLGAIQDEHTKTIDVDWPFAHKVLKFSNVSTATEFLKRRFTNLLLPVPVAFQLNLIILREIDFANHSPVNPIILSGTYICGDFGVLDSRKLTPSLAETLGTTQEDVLKRLAKRAQYLGAIEIEKLKDQEKKFVQTKKQLIIKKQNNLSKYMELLMAMPEKKRLEEYNKFRHQFNNERPEEELSDMGKRKNAQEATECIEIDDSDSDDNEQVQGSSSSLTQTIKRPPTVEKKSAVKSVLKGSATVDHNIKESSPSQSFTSKLRDGYKFVKTASGKLVLLKDDSNASFSTSLTGMKMTIKNNKVIKQNIVDKRFNTSKTGDDKN